MKQKILLIEDDLDSRENTIELLELYNYFVFSASNGEEALSLALLVTPDLILCDIKMPVMNGYHFLEHIRKLSYLDNARFVFFTSSCEKKEIEMGMQMGADDYIIKPYEETNLINTLKMQLNKKRDVTCSN